jgi:hypothetical protein
MGTVMVYVRFSGSSTRTQPLPVIGPIATTIRDQVLNFHLRLGHIYIEFYNLIDRGQDPGRFGSGNHFRYVIIPGGVESLKSTAPDLDDYDRVVEYFRIEPY